MPRLPPVTTARPRARTVLAVDRRPSAPLDEAPMMAPSDRLPASCPASSPSDTRHHRHFLHRRSVDGAHLLALEQDQHPVGKLEDLVEVFADQQDGLAIGSLLEQLGVDIFGRADVDARRLRHHEDVGARAELASDHDLLDIAPRQRPGRRVERGSLDRVAVDEIGGPALDRAAEPATRSSKSKSTRTRFSATVKSPIAPSRMRSSGTYASPSFELPAWRGDAVERPGSASRRPKIASASSRCPLPETPATPRISPARTVNERSSTATVPRSPVPCSGDADGASPCACAGTLRCRDTRRPTISSASDSRVESAGTVLPDTLPLLASVMSSLISITSWSLWEMKINPLSSADRAR